MISSQPLKAPWVWNGGKSRAAHLIWERFGDVPHYIEPFAGTAAVMLLRPHEPRLETINDANCFVACVFRALQAAPDEVAKWCDWPINEADLVARHTWLMRSETALEFRVRMKTDPDYFDAKIAGWWLWGINQWIGSGWCDDSRKTIANQIPMAGTGRGTHAMSTVKLTALSVSGNGVHRKLPSLSGERGTHAPTRRDGLYEWFAALQARLRRVRVACGDWQRVLSPAVLEAASAPVGIFLDPPYDQSDGKQDFKYAVEEAGIAQKVRDWAVENGDNPSLRIALCGYEGHYEMPDDWEVVEWKANGGYSNQGTERNDNPFRERIWFSPHCLKVDRPKQTSMF